MSILHFTVATSACFVYLRINSATIDKKLIQIEQLAADRCSKLTLYGWQVALQLSIRIFNAKMTKIEAEFKIKKLFKTISNELEFVIIYLLQ